jgi:peroxiredoxin Q/BCP
MSLSLGQPAPDFTLVADDGRPWTLSAARGRRVLLVFYPGDNTPVCTAQLCDYRDGVEAFAGLGVDVIGISTDSGESHRQFKEKHGLPFTLLTDKGGQVARAYDAWGMLGMKRAVFLVERDGLIAYAKVESVALFRRTREELLEVIGKAGSAAG